VTSELQQNRYDRLIRRVGGIIGVGSKVSEVLTELFPMIDVEGDRGELQLLSGTVLGMGGANIAGLASERPRVQLFNPVGSGKIVTVTGIWVGCNAVQIVSIGRTTTVLPSGVGTELARDTRQSLIDRPTAKIFTDTQVAIADANMVIKVGSSESQLLNIKNDLLILAPGNGVDVGNSLVSGSITVTFFWRERVAEQSELNF